MRDGGALLLHGVTGSGKTEVYLRAIAEARAAGRGAIVLVPEIALTPQLLARLRARLGDGRERVALGDLARPARRRAPPGARGRGRRGARARAAPCSPPSRGSAWSWWTRSTTRSYKQDATPRYDARQVAALRARAAGAAVVYGTATPRPETWRALPRRTLRARADGSPLPRIEVVDMRLQGAGPVSRPLASALHARRSRGEKAILLASRRGFALMALCRECGWMARCPHCDVALVHHDAPAPARVPPLRPRGARARRVPVVPRRRHRPPGHGGAGGGARPRAAGADGAAGAHGRARARPAAAPWPACWRSSPAPAPAILLGTQMVAKGHDLPDVTVAAVVDADAPLQFAGFRSEERAFALIVQIAGRAGRRGEPARVFVQAHEPAARVVQLGARHAVEEFLDGELARRRAHDLPPFSHLVRIVVEGERAEAVAAAADGIADDLRAAAPGVGLRGPAPLHRLRGRTRRALLLRAGRATEAAAPLRAVLEARAAALRRAGVRAVVDVDPQET